VITEIKSVNDDQKEQESSTPTLATNERIFENESLKMTLSNKKNNELHSSQKIFEEYRNEVK